MIRLEPEQYEVLDRLHLEWSFRYRSLSPGETTLICDLISKTARTVVLSAEGHTEELALSSAIELAEAQFPASKGDGADDAATEHEALLAEREELKKQLAAVKETTDVASSD